jgi:glycosyltransferase involved in cell wall biosynthesis
VKGEGVKHIVHVTSAHPWDDTRIFWKECRAAASRFRVTLVANGNNADSSCDFREANVAVRLLKVQPTRLARMTLGAKECVSEALKLQPAVLHCHDPELLPWVKSAQKRCTVIFDMHEFLPAALQSKPYIRPVLRVPAARAARLGERSLLRGLPVVFAESSYLSHYPWVEESVLVRNFPRREDFIGVVPAGTAEREHYREGANLVIGYFGSITYERGAADAVELCGALRRIGVTVRLELLGRFTARLERELAHLAKANGVLVRFLSARPLASAVPTMRLWDWALSLLRDLPNYRYSVPTKILEYLGCGVPVISTALAASAEVVQRTSGGIVLDPDPKQWVTAEFADALRSVARREELAREGRESVLRDWTWEREGDRLLNFYDRFLGEVG